MQKEINVNAMFVVSGYSMILFCKYCMSHEQISFDGPKCYEISRRVARKHGWVLHKDGYCTCINCKKKNH
jgi:hypothetical protein